jgi:hypothetical protein
VKRGALTRMPPPNKPMHPTADTPALMLRESLEAAGDAGRLSLSLIKPRRNADAKRSNVV